MEETLGIAAGLAVIYVLMLAAIVYLVRNPDL